MQADDLTVVSSVWRSAGDILNDSLVHFYCLLSPFLGTFKIPMNRHLASAQQHRRHNLDIQKSIPDISMKSFSHALNLILRSPQPYAYT